MKRIALLVVAILAANLPSFSTIHTVCNMPYSPGQHNNFNSAQTAASNGDTIYVHGSSFSYGDVSIFVQDLVVIGAGIRPNKQLPLTSTFGRIVIEASGVQIIGLTLNYIDAASYFTSNCAVRKCRFLGLPGGTCLSVYGVAWIIEGCIIDALPSINYAFDMGNNTGSHVIQHNIFAMNRPAIFNLSGSPGNPAYVLNNVFLGDGISGHSALNNTSNIVVRNNIFHGISAYVNPPPGTAIVERNMLFGSGDDNFYPLGDYPDNYTGVDPQFSSYNGAPRPYSFANDFTLFSGSLGNDFGTDGTDVGVFGGVGEIFTVTGEPSIAEITVFDITSPTTVAPGGSLTISVTSKRIK